MPACGVHVRVGLGREEGAQTGHTRRQQPRWNEAVRSPVTEHNGPGSGTQCALWESRCCTRTHTYPHVELQLGLRASASSASSSIPVPGEPKLLPSATRGLCLSHDKGLGSPPGPVTLASGAGAPLQPPLAPHPAWPRLAGPTRRVLGPGLGGEMGRGPGSAGRGSGGSWPVHPQRPPDPRQEVQCSHFLQEVAPGSSGFHFKRILVNQTERVLSPLSCFLSFYFQILFRFPITKYFVFILENSNKQNLENQNHT